MHALAIDQHRHLVKMPAGVGSWSRSSEPAGVGCAELQHPAPDSLIRNVDLTLEKEILDISKAQWELEIQPDGMLNDLGWKAVSAI